MNYENLVTRANYPSVLTVKSIFIYIKYIQFNLYSTFKTTEFDPNSIYIRNIQSKILSLKTLEKLLTVCFIVLTN